MALLTPFDSKAMGREIRIRALLDDLVQAHIAGRPTSKMVIAVWYRKSVGSEDQFLLELITEGFPGFYQDRLSLLWKSGTDSQPYANIKVTSVAYFLDLLSGHPGEVAEYHQNFEVLYFDKNVLRNVPQSEKILDLFHIVTDPRGLIKGWYVSEEEYDNLKSAQGLLSRRGNAMPELGLVKVFESPDFEHCRGIMHVEIAGKWLPFSPEGIRSYTYYTDLQQGRRVYLLFEGGAIYEVLKFEVKTAPEHAMTYSLLEKAPDDRYPEVYLRAVRPSP